MSSLQPPAVSEGVFDQLHTLSIQTSDFCPQGGWLGAQVAPRSHSHEIISIPWQPLLFPTLSQGAALLQARASLGVLSNHK